MDPLQDYQRRYRELTDQVGALGFVSEGTLVHRYTTCGKPTCRCQTDPDQRHGPYWQWVHVHGGGVRGAWAWRRDGVRVRHSR
jgi:hypothetical protein